MDKKTSLRKNFTRYALCFLLAALICLQLAAPVLAAADEPPAPGNEAPIGEDAPEGEAPPKGEAPDAPEGEADPPDETEAPGEEAPPEEMEAAGELETLAEIGADNPTRLGSEENPVKIATWDELMTFAANYNDANYTGYDYKLHSQDTEPGPVHAQLTADLTAPGTPSTVTPPPEYTWVPIGTAAKPFTGVFDGMGHTVRYLHIRHRPNQPTAADDKNLGFFGNVEGDWDGATVTRGIVRNLYMASPVVNTTYSSNLGGIVGFMRNGLISGCGVYPSLPWQVQRPNPSSGGEQISSDDGKIVANVGGIVGGMHGGVVENSFSRTRVIGHNNSRVGGIAGLMKQEVDGAPVIIRDSFYATNHLRHPASGGVGGIAGRIEGYFVPDPEHPEILPESGIFRCHTSVGLRPGGHPESNPIYAYSATGVVGGIAGAVSNAQIVDCVSMPSKLGNNGGSADLLGRIAGTVDANTVLAGNRAFDGILKNGDVVAEPAAAKDGEAVDSLTLRMGDFWRRQYAGATSGTAVENSPWDFTSGRAPALKLMRAKDGLADGSEQNTMLPGYLFSHTTPELDAAIADYTNEENATTIEINNAYELAELAALQNSKRGVNSVNLRQVTVELMADIDLSDFRDWEPIASQYRDYYANDDYFYSFNGTFNGNGHVISGLRSGVATRDAAGALLPGHQPDPNLMQRGFFGIIGQYGSVNDLGFADSLVALPAGDAFTVSDSNIFRTYAAHAGTLAGINAGRVKHCWVDGTLEGATGQKGARVYNENNATGIGGLFGGQALVRTGSNSHSGAVQSSYYVGDVNGTGATYTGGLMGYMEACREDDYDSEAGETLTVFEIDRCFVEADKAGSAVVGDGTVGGITGWMNINGSYRNDIYDSYATIDVIGGEVAGGIVGNTMQYLERAYATGKVQAQGDTAYAGGIVAQIDYKYSQSRWAVALNPSVQGSSGTTGRVAGTITEPDTGSYPTKQVDYNYAWNNLPVNGSAVTGGTDKNNAGADATAEQIGSADFWDKTMKFNGASKTPPQNRPEQTWILADGKLPVLKDMPGSYEQSGTIPEHIGSGAPPQTTPVTGVRLNKTLADLEPGDELTLTATVLPADASDKALTWNIASQSPAGTLEIVGAANAEQVTVRALATGEATLRATTADGGKTAECVITVAIKPRNVLLSEETLALLVGESGQLTASVVPPEAEQTLKWQSLNPFVATVDEDGLVTGRHNGSTYVSVSTPGGLFAKFCAVTVGYQSGTLALSSSHLLLKNTGDDALLTPTVTGLISTATDCKVYKADTLTFADEDESDLVTVAASGGGWKLTPNARGDVGTVLVQVQSLANPRLKALCRVDVYDAGEAADYAQRRLNPTSVTVYTRSEADDTISLWLGAAGLAWSHRDNVELGFSGTHAEVLAGAFRPVMQDEGTVRLEKLAGISELKNNTTYKTKLTVKIDGAEQPNLIPDTLSIKVKTGLPGFKAAAITINAHGAARTQGIRLVGAGYSALELDNGTKAKTKANTDAAKWATLDVNAGTVTVNNPGTKKSGTFYLKATLEGWGSGAVAGIKLSVKSVYTPPALKLAATKLTVNAAVADAPGGIPLQLLAKTAGQSLRGLGIQNVHVIQAKPYDDTEDGTAAPDAGKDGGLTTAEGNTYKNQPKWEVKGFNLLTGRFRLVATNDAATYTGGKVLLGVQVQGGGQLVRLPITVTVPKKGTATRLTASKTTFSLNKDLTGGAENREFAVSLGTNLAGYQLDVSDITHGLTRSGKKATGQLDASFRGDKLVVGVNDTTAYGATYKLKLTKPGLYTDKKDKPKPASITLTVKVAKKDVMPTATLKAKSKVNLTTGATATLTATFANYSGGFDLTAGNAPTFAVTDSKKQPLPEGTLVFTPADATGTTFTVALGENKSMAPNTYYVTATGKAPGGTQFTTAKAKLVVTASTPKIALSTGRVTLHTNDARNQAPVTLTLPEGCEDLRLIKQKGAATSAFDVKWNKEGQVYIGFKDDTINLKKIKGGSVILEVYLEGNTSKAATVKINVTVKKF